MDSYLETEESLDLGSVRAFETLEDGKRSFSERSMTIIGCRALVIRLLKEAMNTYLGGVFEGEVHLNQVESLKAEDWIFCQSETKYELSFNTAWEHIFPDIEPWVVKTRLRHMFLNREAEARRVREEREKQSKRQEKLDRSYETKLESLEASLMDEEIDHGQGQDSCGRRREAVPGSVHRARRNHAGPRDWLEQLLGR
jgi:hypothetical protein